jgi:hypothetical protein
MTTGVGLADTQPSLSHRGSTFPRMDDDFEWDDPEQEPELGELLVSRTADGMATIKARFEAEDAALVNRAIEKMAAQLPRAPSTTDEQHRVDAFVELLRFYNQRRSGTGIRTRTGAAVIGDGDASRG